MSGLYGAAQRLLRRLVRLPYGAVYSRIRKDCKTRPAWEIRRAPDPEPAPAEYMGVHHRGAHVPMPQQRLDGPDVRARFQEMGSKAVPQAVATGPLPHCRPSDRHYRRSLHRRGMQVMPSPRPDHRPYPPQVRRQARPNGFRQHRHPVRAPFPRRTRISPHSRSTSLTRKVRH